MSKLVLAMAVKNEAETIERAIRSVATIIDRAVISIDSLDTENTKAVAERVCTQWQIPVEFMEHVWQNNFSAMRNGVLDKIEQGGGDWVIWVDGHEYLNPQHVIELTTFLATVPPHVWLFSLMIKMLDLQGVERDSFAQSKVWRLGKGIRYSSRAMHNQVDIELCPKERRAVLQNVYIMHSRTEENAKNRAVQRNELLPAMLEPKISEGDEDALFHMLAHYYALGDVAKFEELYAQYKPENSQITDDCKYQIELYMASMLTKRIIEDNERNLLPKAFEHLAKCDNLSGTRNDHLNQRGRLFYFLGCKDNSPEMHKRALKQFELAATYPVPVSQSFAQVCGYTWEPYALMGEALRELKDYSRAWQCFLAALVRGGGVSENIRVCERLMAEKLESENAA